MTNRSTANPIQSRETGRETRSGTFYRNGPPNASHNECLTLFPPIQGRGSLRVGRGTTGQYHYGGGEPAAERIAVQMTPRQGGGTSGSCTRQSCFAVGVRLHRKRETGEKGRERAGRQTGRGRRRCLPLSHSPPLPFAFFTAFLAVRRRPTRSLRWSWAPASPRPGHGRRVGDREPPR